MATSENISAVIPLFNKANCIERALRSVLAQTVSCREIIVVDDGSTDGGGEVVERLGEPRIRLLRQPNQGPSAARNKGIAEARGALIAFLDADDEWKPWFLETVLHLQARHPQAGIYAAAYEVQEPDGRIWTASAPEIPPAPWEGIIPNFFRSALWHSPIYPSAVAIPRQVLDVTGGFVPCRGVAEDAELWARIALRYPIAFSWRVGATYHMEAENRLWGFLVTHVFATDCFERALESQEVPQHLLPDVREFLAHEKLVAASRYILNGQPRRAREILAACKTRRFRRYKLWWWFWSVVPGRCVNLAWRGKRWLCRHWGSWQRVKT